MRNRRSPRQDPEGRATESRGPHVLLVAWLNRKQGLTERYRDTVNGTDVYWYREGRAEGIEVKERHGRAGVTNRTEGLLGLRFVQESDQELVTGGGQGTMVRWEG